MTRSASASNDGRGVKAGRRRVAGVSHCRRLVVGGLKILLPLVALGVFASLFLFSAGYDERISFDGVDVSSLEDGLKLDNPRFTGSTAAGEPFTISADWALPDGPDPEEVELSAVEGEIAMADGRTVMVEAAAGVLYPKAKVVTLSDGLKITTSDGYELTAETGRLDTATDEVIATGGVMASGDMGVITADRMRATRARETDAEGGDDAYIWFENRVRVSVEEPMRAAD